MKKNKQAETEEFVKKQRKKTESKIPSRPIHERILMSLEEFSLMRAHKYQGELLADLRKMILTMYGLNDLTTSESGDIQRNFNNYRKLLKEIGLTIQYDIKQGIYEQYENNPENQYKASAFYLKNMDFRYNENALRLTMRNMKQPADLLYLLINIKYSIEFRLPLLAQYRKMEGNLLTERFLYPSELIVRENNYSLIALDNKDSINKQFLLNRIDKVTSELLTFYNKDQDRLEDEMLHPAEADHNKKKTFALSGAQSLDAHLSKQRKAENFNLKEYLQSEPGNFYNQIISFQLRMTDNFYDKFVQFHDFDDFQIIEQKSNDDVIVEIKTSDYTRIYQLVFASHNVCHLVAPEENRKIYRAWLKNALADLDINE